LAAQLERTDGVDVLTFSWKSALRADYDVFHVHWPENLAKGSTPLKSLARRMFTRVLLFRLRLKRIPIVRTMHNIDRPEGRSGSEYRILDQIDRQTALVIRLNALTAVPGSLPSETIPHGHYRDWFASYPKAEAVRSRLAFFGLVRRYKNVAHLVAVHAELPSEYTLTVAGNPSTADLVSEIDASRAGNTRVELDFHFLTDAELVSVVTESELVVLPYTEMHNSGSVLTSLSLGRPVLVQDNAVNRALAEEVGGQWVQRYTGELTAEDILSATRGIRTIPPGSLPDLHLRDWTGVGRRHLDAYRRALHRHGVDLG